MKRAKGDKVAQRRRYKDRYRGCKICGVRGEQCTECGVASELVARYGADQLSLIVDGAYLHPLGHGHHGAGYGGAGLVLVLGIPCGGTVIASRSCGFTAIGSQDAELHAVIRGSRWAPGVAIYTDSKSTGNHARHGNRELRVYFLPKPERSAAHELADVLSVEGRKRHALSEGASAPSAEVASTEC